MANRLKMAISETIWTLHRRGWSQRRIAAELGINRETVARHLRQADTSSKPANAPIGSEGDDGASKPANAPPGSDEDDGVPKPADAPIGSEDDKGTIRVAVAEPGPRADPQPSGIGRASGCEPYRDLIRAKCVLGPQRAADLPGPGHRPWLRRQLLQRPPVRPPAGEVARPAFPSHRVRAGRRGPDRLRLRGSDRRPRRQAAQDPRAPGRAQPLPQGLQRGGLPPNHR